MSRSQPPDSAQGLVSGLVSGLAKGLTNYGDTGFLLFLRQAFIEGAGYTNDAPARPVIGIANTASANNL